MRRDPSAAALDDLMAALEVVIGSAPVPGTRGRFERYLEVFARWNRTHRMTALGSPDAIVRELFLDSLLFLPLLPPRPLRLLDIGAGSGIPGLPLRLADPSMRLTLLDSRRKRISFLRAACRELDLSDVVVLEGRAEELAVSAQGSRAFDAVVCRAVGPPTRLLPMAMAFLRPGGILVVSGPPPASSTNPIPTPPANLTPTGGPGIEAIHVPIPGSAATRLFLRAVKQGSVPRGT